MRFQISLFVFVLSLFIGGCAHWDRPQPPRTTVFGSGTLAADAVAIEIGIAQLDDSQHESLEAAWRLLDQQKLPLAIRQTLDQNGLRVAIMASQAPAEFERLLKPRPLELEQLDIVEQQLAAKNKMEPKPRLIVHQRIVNHDGETYPIQTSEIHSQMEWTVKHDSAQTFGSGQSVRGLFEIMTLPQGDGSVRLRITPQIQHGMLQPKISVAERSFIFDKGQSVIQLNELLFDVPLKPGETLVVAPTADVADLGKLFFGHHRPKQLNSHDLISDQPHAEKKTLVQSLNELDLGPLELGQLDQLADRLGKESREKSDEEREEAELSGSPRQTIPPQPDHLTHRILMIRVVQTQMDDVFGQSGSRERLTSTSRR